MFDFRTDKKGKTLLITCDCCGQQSIVNVGHKMYCPVCGPDVVANFTVSALEDESAPKHHIDVTYELTIRRGMDVMVTDKVYEELQEGIMTYLRKDMKKAIQEATLNVIKLRT